MVRTLDVLLWGAAVAALSAALAAFFHTRGQGADHYRRAERLAWASVAFQAAALLVYLVQFVTADVRLAYVHAHTRADAPLAYRIAGLWGGREGTLLMWSAFAGAALAGNATLWRRHAARTGGTPPDAGHPLPWTLAVGSLVVTALLLLLLQHDPFRPTEAWRLVAEPGGRGLQPVLETPFMVLHPPLQFLAYGLAVLLYAAAVAHLVTGRREWADVALPWAKWTLAISWTGLGIGALWAYYVLNFGGYWAWDPVETANLLAFLPLVPLVHALIYFRKRGMFGAIGPLFAVLAFLSTLFSSLATRTGLWVSVHAFTDPARTFDPDALQRLLDIVEADAPLRTLLRIFLAAGLVALAGLSWRTGREAASADRAPRALAAAGGGAAAGALVLVLADPRLALGALFEAGRLVWPAAAPVGLGLVLVAFGLLYAAPHVWARDDAGGTHPRDPWAMANMVWAGMLVVIFGYLIVFLVDVMTVNGYRRELYDDRAAWFAVPFLLVLGVGLSNKFVGVTRSVMLAAASLAAGVALAWMMPGPWPVWLGLPVGVFAFAGAMLKLVKVSDDPSAPRDLRLAGVLVVVGGVAAFAYWANPPTRIPLGVTTLHPGPWWVLAGLPLAFVSLFGGAAALRRENYRAALLGCAALVASLAWVVAVPAGLAAAALLARRRDLFARGRTGWDLRESMTRLKREVRKTGVYLVHVALVLGMAGYATSVWWAGAEEPLTLERGERDVAHGYGFELTGSTTAGRVEGTGLAAEVRAWVTVTRGGTVLDNRSLVMWHELPAHYAERVTVHRFMVEDVYLRPVRVNATTPQGTSVSFFAHEDGVFLPPGTRVDAVTFTVKTLPGMHLVWAGVWGISAGALGSLAAGGSRLQAKAPPRGAMAP